MARVEIEERAWSDSRLKKLAQRLGLTPALAMGVLASLWHDSQNEGVTSVALADLEDWFAAEIALGYDIVGMLQASGYIEKQSSGMFRIDGNRARLMKVNFYKDRAKKSAEARWQKHKTKGSPKEEQRVTENATSNAQAMLASRHQASVKQCLQHDSMTARQHDNEERSTSYSDPQSRARVIAHAKPAGPLERADAACDEPVLATAPAAETIDVPWERGEADDSDRRQNDKTVPGIDATGGGRRSAARKPKNASAAKAERLAGVGDVIAAYVTAYREKFGGTRPSIQGPQAGAAKRIVAEVGIERAKELVVTYLGMGDKWFATKHYDLLTMAGNLNAVMLFHDKGQSITGSMAKAVEQQANNDAVIARVAARYAQAGGGSGGA